MHVKIYLAAFGSRGDNEPFRALAAEADAAGHEVYFAHTSDLAAATMAQEDGAGVALTIIERAEGGVSPLRPA